MKRLVVRTILPALLAIGLFSGVVFFSFLPSLDRGDGPETAHDP